VTEPPQCGPSASRTQRLPTATAGPSERRGARRQEPPRFGRTPPHRLRRPARRALPNERRRAYPPEAQMEALDCGFRAPPSLGGGLWAEGTLCADCPRCARAGYRAAP
jgi:hypothetical protein